MPLLMITVGCTCPEKAKDDQIAAELARSNYDLRNSLGLWYRDEIDETKFSPMDEILKDCRYNNEQAKATCAAASPHIAGV